MTAFMVRLYKKRPRAVYHDFARQTYITYQRMQKKWLIGLGGLAGTDPAEPFKI